MYINKYETIKPWEIRYVNFGDENKCLQGGIRPALISQNSMGCKFSPIINVIPLTSRVDKVKNKNLPTHVFIPKTNLNGLKCDSVALIEQQRPILKENIGSLIGIMEEDIVYKCGDACELNSSLFFKKKDNIRKEFAVA